MLQSRHNRTSGQCQELLAGTEAMQCRPGYDDDDDDDDDENSGCNTLQLLWLAIVIIIIFTQNG